MRAAVTRVPQAVDTEVTRDIVPTLIARRNRGGQSSGDNAGQCEENGEEMHFEIGGSGDRSLSLGLVM